VDGARTRGHIAALAVVEAMVRGPAPHAVLISGPAGVGKTTLALDLAAGLFCTAPDPAARPCRSCRSCRLIDRGDHADLHWLRPEGPGGQIIIGKPSDAIDGVPPRGVRHLIHDLARLPVEGGTRVAIIESAHRMNEDAQGALLKTLEEPPPGATLILCADEESRLLPTIRSRCARIRLGTVGPRDVEAILGALGAADAPTAARLGRIVGGRPGLALAYARVPEAIRIRGELARTLLDLLAATPSTRLAAMRAAMTSGMTLVAALDAGAALELAGDSPPARAGARGRTSRAAAKAPTPAASPTSDANDDGEPVDEDGDDEEARPKTAPASQRRRAAEAIVGIWLDLARDLALVAAGGAASVRDVDLLDELEAAVRTLDLGAPAAALAALERGATLLAANVSPELVLDSLALDWPRRRHVA